MEHYLRSMFAPRIVLINLFLSSSPHFPISSSLSLADWPDDSLITVAEVNSDSLLSTTFVLTAFPLATVVSVIDELSETFLKRQTKKQYNNYDDQKQ